MLSSSTPEVPSKEQFIAEVRKFKKLHGKHLKELLSIENSESVKDFFQNPIIRAYLQRDARNIGFFANHTNLTPAASKSGRSSSDYHELRIYKLMRHFFYFRADATKPLFYNKGTSTSVGINLISMIQEKYNSKSLHIALPRDVYGIRDLLFALCYPMFRNNGPNELLDNKQLRFLLTPNYKDGHATLICSVLEEDTQQVLVSVFIDSRERFSDFRYIDSRLNLKGGYAINMSAYRNIDKNKLNDVTFCTSVDETEMAYLTKPIQFIDASHELQTNSEDNNCAIYSLNFLKGIVNMLNNQVIADQVYQLARRINQGDETAKTALVAIFREILKSYLPCYYDANRNAKSYVEIKQYHMKQRWEIDGDAIGDVGALARAGFVSGVRIG